MLAYSHLSANEVKDVPDAWHPVDLLVAPLLDDEGVLRGLLSVDSPVDGRRPGPIQRAALSSYAGVARTQVLLALEREELQARVRLSTETREIVRRALGEHSLDKVVEASRTAVADCFDAAGMWLSAFDSDGGATSTWWSHYGYDLPMFDELDELAVRLAHALLGGPVRRAPLARATSLHPGLSPEEVALAGGLPRERADRVGAVRPAGCRDRVPGLPRPRATVGHPAWTEMEYDAALDIGRDLGRAIANARQLEQERALVDRLRELDRYRTELDEHGGPRAAQPAGLRVGPPRADRGGGGPLRATCAARSRPRSAARGRLEGVIDELLAMARVSDPDAAFDPVPVDLRDVVARRRGRVHPRRRREVDHGLDRRARAEAFVVADVPDELHRLLANLLSNAVKYSHEDSSVAVELARDEQEVVVRVIDHGLGISEEDQLDLFKEFFRSNNPEALARPGSGLGLVIVDRIVRRHGGRIAVESALGHGTTVTVRLPAAPAGRAAEPATARSSSEAAAERVEPTSAHARTTD